MAPHLIQSKIQRQYDLQGPTWPCPQLPHTFTFISYLILLSVVACLLVHILFQTHPRFPKTNTSLTFQGYLLICYHFGNIFLEYSFPPPWSSCILYSALFFSIALFTTWHNIYLLVYLFIFPIRILAYIPDSRTGILDDSNQASQLKAI